MNKQRNISVLKVTQWNCRGIKGKLSSLQLVDSNTDILYLQETLLHVEHEFRLTGFRIISKDILHPGSRGIAILIRDNIFFSNVDISEFSHSSVEIMGISVEVCKQVTLIVNLYRHPRQYTPQCFFDKLLNIHSSDNRFNHVIIVGDFNYHHHYWGNDSDDSTGNKLAKALDFLNWTILNDDKPTFITPPEISKSIIDLTLATASLAPI
jgi:exonuclease III